MINLLAGMILGAFGATVMLTFYSRAITEGMQKEIRRIQQAEMNDLFHGCSPRESRKWN